MSRKSLKRPLFSAGKVSFKRLRISSTSCTLFLTASQSSSAKKCLFISLPYRLHRQLPMITPSGLTTGRIQNSNSSLILWERIFWATRWLIKPCKMKLLCVSPVCCRAIITMIGLSGWSSLRFLILRIGMSKPPRLFPRLSKEMKSFSKKLLLFLTFLANKKLQVTDVSQDC